MIRIQKTALVAYTADEMFTLVNNIANYPNFLPWCKSVTIHSQTESEIVATLKMGSVGLKKSFSTTNVIKPNESIEVRLLEGPFSHLEGHWNFQQLGDAGCKISLNMEFEISNKLLRISLEPVFTKIANTLVDAFVQRANELHGKS
ncbi:type II toxin-antitoxin system RatA family toxin [Candidatus Parabeggiatoa sp. HSG14]|uniref:type II toxin-antitoxin system RatA family toxin n=1 Tax=Candidatus Parabeggiatoa sp. HSG14 TaxID=3055593 RepID=UPI0025A7D82E|nr:type II toxin-antitoxin system RatA family toxin [Thiotrichales bacterium HSG14]